MRLKTIIEKLVEQRIPTLTPIMVRHSVKENKRTDTRLKTIVGGLPIVLMNGYSASATGEFIGHLKNINRAIFIGEEAGGNPVIFTGGQRLPVDLPHTHIAGYLPLMLTEMNVKLKNTGHGIIPDYKVKPTIKEILQEKDVEMEFAMDLIKKRTN